LQPVSLGAQGPQLPQGGGPLARGWPPVRTASTTYCDRRDQTAAGWCRSQSHTAAASSQLSRRSSHSW